METSNDLEDRLKKLEGQIREIKSRLPAHSAKPAMVMALMSLEDERDALLSMIQTQNEKNGR